MEIRDAHDEDSEGLFALLKAVFEEYGCIFDRSELPELCAGATHFAREGGHLWVAIDGCRLVGSGGFTASGAPGSIELRRLYVAREQRGSGLGVELCARVEQEARARGASYVELWSDTRFTRAHRFYERRGYVRGQVTRELHDLSETVEFYYRLDLLPGS